jgi:probable addiction module antidote protein
MTEITTKDIEELKKPDIAERRLKTAIDELMQDIESENLFLELRRLTKAQGGMSRLSKKIGINRQNLYRTFASDGNPKLRSLATILNGLGYKLSIEPLGKKTVPSNDFDGSVKTAANASGSDQEAA